MQKRRPALGAAFSHARKVEAKTGGGQKKQHEVAARYLRRKRMPAMTKAADFVESEHPRANDGQFSDGSGAHGGPGTHTDVKPAGAKVVRDKVTHSAPPHRLPKEADGLPPSPTPENSHAYALGSKSNPTTEDRQATSKGKYSKMFTAKEKAALQAYSKEDGYTAYTNVNISVKAEAEDNLADIEKTAHGRAYNQDMRHAARLINQAIAHSPLPEDKMLYRGGHIPESLGVGDVFCSPQFTSTSGSEGVAEFFTERLSGNRPLLKIQAHKGDKVFDYGQAFRDASEEEEFLFGSFQRFHVVGIEKDEESGRKVVHLSTRPVPGQAKVIGKSMTKSDKSVRPSKGLGLRLMGNMPASVIGKKKKIERIIKAMPGTLGAYRSAIAQSSAPGHLSDDDKYAMSRYAALFDRNHQAMAQARAEYFARMLAQRSR